MICYDLHTISRLSSGCRNLYSECKAIEIFSNFLVIWDKVAFDQSDIVHRLTQNTRNTIRGGTPLYGLYRYVRPQRVGFCSRLGHKQGIDFCILVLNIEQATSLSCPRIPSALCLPLPR